MKLNIAEINTEPIRKLLLFTDSYHSIHISNEDVDNLFDSATRIDFLVTHGNSLQEALHNLDADELDFDKAKKVIIIVRNPEPFQMSVSEIAQLNSYINEYFPQADVRWGVASKKGDENIVVIAATSY